MCGISWWVYRGGTIEKAWKFLSFPCPRRPYARSVCVFAVGVRSSTKIQYKSGGARVAQVRMMYDTPLT